MSVFVLDKRQRPLMPCSEKRAQKLLESGRARVARRYPFTWECEHCGGGFAELTLAENKEAA